MNELKSAKVMTAKTHLAQLILLGVICASSAAVDGVSTVPSIAAGGATVIIPQWLFSLYALRSERSGFMVLSRLVQGHALKLSATVILIYLSLAKLTIEPLLFFCAYALLQVVSWLLTFALSQAPQQSKKLSFGGLR